ncbi:hypothetical protein LH417_07905 [Laribacter hongkongensis]|uniref:hypothetical protein n=1 Tax=Laribacter hongkongensis TaxID=168471 RepID=UPI001EFD4AF7|nr:hypothetical protein [Laribacter hongkongensis]MCG9022864.1 hypothetical protein [Laribacter hongkongensis]
MTEPGGSVVVLTATSAGLTVFGMATGLRTDILLAGLAGGRLAGTLFQCRQLVASHPDRQYPGAASG